MLGSSRATVLRGGEAGEPAGTMPAFGAAGTVGTTGALDTITPAYPTGITAGQLLTLHTIATAVGATPPAIITDLAAAGWSNSFNGTAFDDSRTTGGTNTIRLAVWWKYAVGSETGTLSVQFATAGNRQAYISRFTNPHATAPWEAVATLVQGSDDPITGPSITPLGLNRLGVAFLAWGDNSEAATALASATGGTWTMRTHRIESAGQDSAINMQTVDLSAGGAISGGSFDTNMVTTADWLVRGVALRPTGS